MAPTCATCKNDDWPKYFVSFYEDRHNHIVRFDSAESYGLVFHMDGSPCYYDPLTKVQEETAPYRDWLDAIEASGELWESHPGEPTCFPDFAAMASKAAAMDVLVDMLDSAGEMSVCKEEDAYFVTRATQADCWHSGDTLSAAILAAKEGK